MNNTIEKYISTCGLQFSIWKWTFLFTIVWLYRLMSNWLARETNFFWVSHFVLWMESHVKNDPKLHFPLLLPLDFGQSRKHRRKWTQHKDKISFCTHFTVSDTNFDSCFIRTASLYIGDFTPLKFFILLLKYSNNLFTKEMWWKNFNLIAPKY